MVKDMLNRIWRTTGRISVDYKLERVQIGNDMISLPRKPMCVLLELLKAAPETMSRDALIEELWGGNFLTGEKGLTQALWSVRVALEETGGDPDWIRTVSRSGYKWVGPSVTMASSLANLPEIGLRRRVVVGLAACCVLAASGAIFDYLQHSAPSPVQRIVAANGAIALVNHRAVMVADHKGRHVNFLAEPPAVLRSAAFSTDGEKLIIAVTSGKRCQIRVFEFNTQNMENYETCAHQTAGSV